MFNGHTRGWIGIDLGTSTVKLAQVQRSGAQWRLVHARILRHDPADGGLGPPGEAPGWWETVCRDKDLRSGFAGRRAAAVLPATATDLRAIHLPEGSERDRRAMIAGELESISFPVAGRRSFDFWDSRPPAAEGESKLENVNVLSVLEDDAAALAGALAEAGLHCEAIDGLPLVLARAVEIVSAADPQVPVAAVDWGCTSATFTVICQGRPVFTRYLRDCGFAALPAAVGDALGLSHADAEQLLTTHGLPDPGRRGGGAGEIQEILADVLSPSLGAMISQLNKTLAYPELHRSRLIPQRAWLLGGGATVRNMAAFLSARVGLPFETWRLPGTAQGGSAGNAPLALLGPAVALSALGLPNPRTHDPV